MQQLGSVCVCVCLCVCLCVCVCMCRLHVCIAPSGLMKSLSFQMMKDVSRAYEKNINGNTWDGLKTSQHTHTHTHTHTH